MEQGMRAYGSDSVTVKMIFRWRRTELLQIITCENYFQSLPKKKYFFCIFNKLILLVIKIIFQIVLTNKK